MSPESPPTSPPPLVPSPAPSEPPATQPKPSTPPPNPLSTRRAEDMLEPDERLLTVIHRHPIGIIFIYLEALLGVVAIVAVAIAVGGSSFKNLSGTSQGLALAGVILALAMLVFFLFVATYVYRQNHLIITDRGVIEVLQRSLFIRKVTRLSFSNVEDVSAESRGILPTVFGYGTLLVQTAGTLDNFEFIYCPNPTNYADIIIEAREKYAQSLKEEDLG